MAGKKYNPTAQVLFDNGRKASVSFFRLHHTKENMCPMVCHVAYQMFKLLCLNLPSFLLEQHISFRLFSIPNQPSVSYEEDISKNDDKSRHQKN